MTIPDLLVGERSRGLAPQQCAQRLFPKVHTLGCLPVGGPASAQVWLVSREDPWLWSQTDPSSNPLCWFRVRGPLASYLTSLCFCFLICEPAITQPTAKDCWKIRGEPILVRAHRGPHHVILLLPSSPTPDMQHVQRKRAVTWNENTLEYIHHSNQLRMGESHFRERILTIPANQKFLITFNSPRGSLSRLSYLLWEGKAALALLT